MATRARGGSSTDGLSIEGRGLRDLQAKLKTLDDPKVLRKELNLALRMRAQHLIKEAREAAREELPQEGGLADRIANAPMRVSVTSGRNPGVRIVVKGVDARSTNRGRLRHPTYGHRDRWVTQEIKPGWFTDRMREKAPSIRPALVEAMDEVAKKAARA